MRTEAVRPSKESARAVALAWRQILGSDPVSGISFAEAAGDSLMLLMLVFALERHVGARLPLDGFSVTGDAAGMALALDAALQQMGPQAQARPAGRVFLVPGVGGDTPALAALRADCRDRVAMDVFAYPDWRTMVQDRLRMEDLAAALLDRVRVRAPDGDATLVGYSLGAQIASIVAFALETEGRGARRLVILDMPATRSTEEEGHVWTLPATMRELWWELHRPRHPGPAQQQVGRVLARLAGSPKVRPALPALARSTLAKRLMSRTGSVGHWAGHMLAWELRLIEASAWSKRWRAPERKLQAPVSLIRTSLYHADPREDLGWGELAGRVDVTHVPGDHISMLAPANRPAVVEALLQVLV